MNWIIACVGTAVLLAGCGTGGDSHSAGAPPKRTAPATGAPASTSVRPLPPAKDGGHVTACRDGDCEVTVRSGTKIPLSRRFGLGQITVTVDGPDVGLRTHTAETDTNDTITAPGTVTLNDITVDILDAHDNVATLSLSHHR